MRYHQIASRWRLCTFLREPAWVFAVFFFGAFSCPLLAQVTPGEVGALGNDRITQDMIESGRLSFSEIRLMGRRIFSTPFNKLDGYGDGPMDPENAITPGGRPTLQDNGTFLRVNGLDSQTCLECHSVLSSTVLPFAHAVGGLGTGNDNAIFQPSIIDVVDSGGSGFAAFNGRFINPPFLFGSGGVELLAKEMTAELQALKSQAQANPGTDVTLITKGVQFGSIRFEDGRYDTSGIVGIDPDLVVRPFGRKGEFASTRAFDIGAMQFHFGMQAVEAVGDNVDADGDGVVNEVLIGEISALALFNTTLERPVTDPLTDSGKNGQLLFNTVGCAECHIPALITTDRFLTFSFPEVPTHPDENVFYQVDLSDSPAAFQSTDGGGLVVPLFADLKRHDMGPELAESFGSPLDAQFTTARLWGVADSAPYLHDGRAMTLTDAIIAHGGEAEASRAAFMDLSDSEKVDLLTFLRSLRTPECVGVDCRVSDNRMGMGPGLCGIGVLGVLPFAFMGLGLMKRSFR